MKTKLRFPVCSWFSGVWSRRKRGDKKSTEALQVFQNVICHTVWNWVWSGVCGCEMKPLLLGWTTTVKMGHQWSIIAVRVGICKTFKTIFGSIFEAKSSQICLDILPKNQWISQSDQQHMKPLTLKQKNSHTKTHQKNLNWSNLWKSNRYSNSTQYYSITVLNLHLLIVLATWGHRNKL